MSTMQCQACFGTGRNKKGGPCQSCRGTGRIGKVGATFQALGALASLLFALAVIVIIIIVAIVSSGGSSSKPSRQACITNAPGTLYGDDARNYCEDIKTGQSVNPGSVGRRFARQCARLGVHGLR